MALSPGTRLEGYEILGHLGSGGMGDVYRARDLKLGREVAVKLLAGDVAASEERLSRFEREARVLASLNHPGIATLHGLETSSEGPLLVMELVEGETLAQRLVRSSLPVDEATDLFQQIAEALESAHGKGILHRDLKPSNVMITPEGRVKLLDFGLAKAFLDELPETGASQSPTLTRGTAHGVILGTAAYMSPEQARGKPVDRRTDVWAFGAVLYEALTGRKAFSAETVTDTLAAVVRGEPDFTALPRETPPRLRELLERCLRKDPQKRLQHIGDARVLLEEATSPEASSPETTRRSWLTPALAAFAAAALLWTILRPGVEQPPLTRTALNFPSGAVLDRGVAPSVAISPDGRTVASIVRNDGTPRLHLRSLSDLEGTFVPGTEWAGVPFFSPDGNWVGFRASAQLWKVPLSGGAPAAITDRITSNVRGASWGNDGRIVFTDAIMGGLSEVGAEGGEVSPLTETDRARREKTHRLAEVLPGGRAVLFTLGTGDIGTFDEASIAVFSRETGTYRVLVEGGSNPRYSRTGHILYARAGSILALPFDEDALEVRGTPVTVVEDVATSPIYGHAEFALSDEGTLVYARGGAWGHERRVVWVDRSGNVEPLVEEERTYEEAYLSPDGRSLALTIEGANPTIWIYDISRGTMTRLAAGFDNDFPVWTPDGRRVAFRSNRSGRYEIYWQAADGSGGAEVLVSSDGDVVPDAWTPDGRILAFRDQRGRGGWTELFAVSIDDGERTKLQSGNFFFWQAQFSPDGRWLAYTSDESGRFEVYLRAFPEMGRKWQVSTEGGAGPRFGRDGREIFYFNGAKLMAVGIETAGDVALGKPRQLFEKGIPGLFFDVSSDGRFVFIEDTSEVEPPSELVLVQNFFSELERLVPSR